LKAAATSSSQVNSVRAQNPGHKAEVAIVASSLLAGYPDRIKTKTKKVLEGLGVKVIIGARVSSPASAQVINDLSFFTVEVDNGTTVPNVAAYVPAYVSKVNTDWLAEVPGALDAQSKKVDVDEYLQCKTNTKIFAIGGCSNLKESTLNIPKMEGQAKTIAHNISATISGKNTKRHAEAMPDMKNAPLVLVGSKTFAAIVPEVLPSAPACCLR